MLGTLVAQLFTIDRQNNGFGHILLGKPLAVVCFALAVMTILLGAIRAFRLQMYLVRGKALAGGFETYTIGLVILLVSWVLDARRHWTDVEQLLLACFGVTLAMDALPGVDES